MHEMAISMVVKVLRNVCISVSPLNEMKTTQKQNLLKYYYNKSSHIDNLPDVCDFYSTVLYVEFKLHLKKHKK